MRVEQSRFGRVVLGLADRTGVKRCLEIDQLPTERGRRLISRASNGDAPRRAGQSTHRSKRGKPKRRNTVSCAKQCVASGCCSENKRAWDLGKRAEAACWHVETPRAVWCLQVACWCGVLVWRVALAWNSNAACLCSLRCVRGGSGKDSCLGGEIPNPAQIFSKPPAHPSRASLPRGGAGARLGSV